MNLYAELYDVVSDNLQKAGMNFGYEKSTFLCGINSSSKEIDVSKYLELNNEAFFQAVFVSAFKRLPEDKECAKWSGRMSLSKEKFQKAFLLYIANSNIVAINHMEIINNPYFTQKKGLRYKATGVLYGLTDKSSMREFGKKLPAPIQKIIRKIFL